MQIGVVRFCISINRYPSCIFLQNQVSWYSAAFDSPLDDGRKNISYCEGSSDNGNPTLLSLFIALTVVAIVVVLVMIVLLVILLRKTLNRVSDDTSKTAAGARTSSSTSAGIRTLQKATNLDLISHMELSMTLMESDPCRDCLVAKIAKLKTPCQWCYLVIRATVKGKFRPFSEITKKQTRRRIRWIEIQRCMPSSIRRFRHPAPASKARWFFGNTKLCLSWTGSCFHSKT